MTKQETRLLIGANIKKFRIMRGHSQTELAIGIGKKSPAYISFIEKGQRNISVADLFLMTEFLKTSIDKLTVCGKKFDNR